MSSNAAPMSWLATRASSSFAAAISPGSASRVRPRRSAATARARSSASSPLTRTVDQSGTASSPCWPPTNPPTRCRRTPSSTAISRRNRSVSSQAPMPSTRCRPSRSAMTATPSSTGLVTTITTSCPEPCRAIASAYSASTAPLVAASTRRSGSAPVRAGGVRPAATTMTSAVTSSGECATSRSGACSSYASTRSARSPCTARPDAPPARPTSWSRAVGGSTRRSTICVHTCRPTSPVAPTTATSTPAGYDAPRRRGPPSGPRDGDPGVRRTRCRPRRRPSRRARRRPRGAARAGSRGGARRGGASRGRAARRP